MSEAETGSSEDETSSVDRLTNFEFVREPRPLTRGEVEAGVTQTRDSATRPYYAIKRGDGYVGIAGNSERHTETPKIHVLYTTADGTRSFTLPYMAREGGEDGDHEFVKPFTAVAARQPGIGKPTKEGSIQEFRELARGLHDLGGEASE